MLPRACRSAPLFPSEVCGGPERLLVSGRWGRALYGVAPAVPPSLHNAPRQGSAGAGPTSASVHDPRSLWAALAGSLRSTLRWPRPAVPVRAAADAFRGQRRIDAPPPTSAWPSRAALRPASDHDRRPAGGRLSTAVGCSRGGARQSADHGSALYCRSAHPAAPWSLPSYPKTPRGAPGRCAQDGAARCRGAPVASR